MSHLAATDSARQSLDGQRRPTIPKAELDALLEVNKSWPYPARLDGWVKAHDAIRADLDDLAE